VPGALPFEDSRRLTGNNLFFPAMGAVLELARGLADARLLEGWRARVELGRSRLGWKERPAVARAHRDGTSLALAAPPDQLFTATELNEWAVCAALAARDPTLALPLREALVEAARAQSPSTGLSDAPEIDEPLALARLERLAAAERRPALPGLLAAAELRNLSCLLDDEQLSIGEGAGSCRYALRDLPDASEVSWTALHDIPTAIVTGSNGKTTTVRLIAACLRATGRRTGYCCTDGLFLDDEWLERGDYSGPVGTRSVLRDTRVQAAVLEAARGGILRRGLAVSRAGAAVVTNVSADHFGEYGIHDLDALADVKLTVASTVVRSGLLVLNADDPVLRAKAEGLRRRFGRGPKLGWFAHDARDPFLVMHRAAGGATCGIRAGRLRLAQHGIEYDLGAVAGLPLAVGGRATYNVANLSAAALAAAALGATPHVIAGVFARFGERTEDNPGRLMRFACGGAQVIVDYAHNPEGLRGLLEVAEADRIGDGRLGLILGHAGNRGDAELERLAAVAAEFRPSLVVVKELEHYLRGREPGEVPAILCSALLRAGLPESTVVQRPNELEAVQSAIEWARPGDVLVLPVHGLEAREAVVALLRSRPG
jgi:UDP-N-acetylmuramyl tripeptide synthase